MKVIAAKRAPLVAQKQKNYLADEIVNYTNQLSDMRDMQHTLVQRYKQEIEDLRQQRDHMLHQKGSSMDYLTMNQDFKTFNDGRWFRVIFSYSCCEFKVST